MWPYYSLNEKFIYLQPTLNHDHILKSTILIRSIATVYLEKNRKQEKMEKKSKVHKQCASSFKYHAKYRQQLTLDLHEELAW